MDQAIPNTNTDVDVVPEAPEPDAIAVSDENIPLSDVLWTNSGGDSGALIEPEEEPPVRPDPEPSENNSTSDSGDIFWSGFSAFGPVNHGMRSFYQREARKMAKDFSGWLSGLDEESRRVLDSRYAVMPEDERQAEQEKLIGAHYIASDTGLSPLTVIANWQVFSHAYAQWRGEGWEYTINNPAALAVRIREEITREENEETLISGPTDEMPKPEKVGFWGGLFGGEERAKAKVQPKLDVWNEVAKASLTYQAREAAFEGTSSVKGFVAWLIAAMKKPGYDERRIGEYFETWNKVNGQMAGVMVKARPVGLQAHDLVTKARGLRRGKGDKAPYKLFRGLTPEEKDAAIRLMFELGGGEDKIWTHGLVESVSRSFENLWAGTSADMRRFLVHTRFKEGDLVKYDKPEDEILARYAMASSTDEGSGAERAVYAFQSDKVLSADDAVKWNQEVANEINDIETAEVLRGVGLEIDENDKAGGPIYRYAGKPVADSTATIATLIVPYTWPAGFKLRMDSYDTEDYMRLRARNMDPEQASGISIVSGLGRSAMDQLELGAFKNFGSKWMPKTSYALRRFALSGSKLARFAANTGGTVMTQTAIEQLQDHLIPALVQDILAQDPEFDVEWANVWLEVLRSAPRAAAGMLLLSAAGGLLQTKNQSEAATALASSKFAMRIRGYSRAEIAEIQAASLKQRGALLAKYLRKKAPTGAEKEQLVADALEFVREEEAIAARQIALTSSETTQSKDPWASNAQQKAESAAATEAAPKLDAAGLPPAPEILPSDSKLLGDSRTRLTTPDGTPREVWREQQIQAALAEGIPMPPGKRVLYCMAGGPGAGKSVMMDGLREQGTLPASGAIEINPDYFTEINPDFIAVAKTGDSRGARVVEMESSDMARELFERALKTGAPIIYDATLANPKVARAVAEAAKAAGYETRLFAVTHDAMNSLRGARRRAQNTGRYVTTDYGLESHASLNANVESYVNFFDQWELHDRKDIIAKKVDGEIVVEPGRKGAYEVFYERARSRK